MPTIQFSKNMFRRGRQVENSAAKIVRSMAKKSLRSLVLATKADTGQARSNWRVGIGAPTRAVIAPYSPYKKHSKANGQGMAETANASAAIAAGIARIDSVRGKSGVGLTTSIYISNSVPYIDKALTTGAVEVSILEARSVVRGLRVFDPRNDDEGGDI